MVFSPKQCLFHSYSEEERSLLTSCSFKGWLKAFDILEESLQKNSNKQTHYLLWIQFQCVFFVRFFQKLGKFFKKVAHITNQLSVAFSTKSNKSSSMNSFFDTFPSHRLLHLYP